MRRRSPIDPPDGAWAVIGTGPEGLRVLNALSRAGVPAVGYDSAVDRPRQRSGESGRGLILPEHEPLLLVEIEENDYLALTTMDRTNGVISTDYFAGVVIDADGSDWNPAPEYVDEELLAFAEGRVGLARGMFSPHCPALLVVGLGASAVYQRGPDPRRPERHEANPPSQRTRSLPADFAAGYAALLVRDPRRALAFHRTACRGPIPSAEGPAAGSARSEEDLLRVDLLELGQAAAPEQ